MSVTAQTRREGVNAEQVEVVEQFHQQEHTPTCLGAAGLPPLPLNGALAPRRHGLPRACFTSASGQRQARES